MREGSFRVNVANKENRRFFAVVSVGRNRWYWVVWPSLRELQASDEPRTHINEGYEKTKAEAVEKALELAGSFAEWIAAKYAAAYHRARPGATQKVDSLHIIVHEFLYRDIYDATTGQWSSVPHRVVQRTKKYIYVEQSPYPPEDMAGSWLDGKRATFRLDRQALEQEGYAFVPATASLTDEEEPIFFTYERVNRQGTFAPACLVALGLSWPCTTSEVKDAYRRLIRSAHPDGGGSHEKFLDLQAAYAQALRMCQ
jgi:hypothetical protein